MPDAGVTRDDRGRFGLDPRAARVAWTILVFLAALGVRLAQRWVAGGEVAGVAGMFLSVPLIAAARIVARRLQAPEPHE